MNPPKTMFQLSGVHCRVSRFVGRQLLLGGCGICPKYKLREKKRRERDVIYYIIYVYICMYIYIYK